MVCESPSLAILVLTQVSGGHGTSGDSSTDGGLLINLRKLNTVTVDPANRTVTCAGGCIWAEIDAAAAAHNLSLVGGTVNRTGVAGYTTGGGFGWLSGRYGLAIDNMVSAEIVTADGRIRTCSETQEPDLFWAIRGAGHMFGVVTSFTFRAHPQPNPIYGGMVVFPPRPDAIKHLIDFANSIQATSDGRTAMFCGFTTPPAIGKRAIFGCCFHDGPAAEGRDLFAPLIDTAPIPPVKSTLGSMPFAAMNEVLAVAAASEGRRVSKGACYSGPLPPAAFQKVLNMYEDFVANVCPEAGESGACLFEFYPLAKVCSVPGSATAFPNRTPHSNAMLIPRWRSAKYDAVCRQFTRDAMDALKAAVSERGGSTGEYLNYDGLGTPAERTFGDNYPRLRALKARYDPANVFDKRQGLRAPEVGAEVRVEPVAKRARREEEREQQQQRQQQQKPKETENEKMDEENASSSAAESSTAPTTPEAVPEPANEEEKITHEIVISARGGEDVDGGRRTEEIRREVSDATAKLRGVNVVVSVRSVEGEVQSD